MDCLVQHLICIGDPEQLRPNVTNYCKLQILLSDASELIRKLRSIFHG